MHGEHEHGPDCGCGEEIEVNIRPAGVVAERVLCLLGLVTRAMAEHTIACSTDPEVRDLPDAPGPEDVDRARTLCTGVKEWMVTENLWDKATDTEKAMLERPAGEWSRQDVTEGLYTCEQLGVLAWALRELEELPEYDQLFHPDDFRVLPVMSPTAQFIKAAGLRDEDELFEAQDEAALWTWRCITREQMQQKPPPPLPGGVSYGQMILETTKHAAKDGFFKPISGDFPVMGKPFRDLDEEEFLDVAIVTVRRSHALEWLMGMMREWEITGEG